MIEDEDEEGLTLWDEDEELTLWDEDEERKRKDSLSRGGIKLISEKFRIGSTEEELDAPFWTIIAKNGGGLCPPGSCTLKLPALASHVLCLHA